MIRTRRAATRSTWNDLPWKFEAGTSMIAEGVGLGAAVDYLSGLGMENVRAHERALVELRARGACAEVGGVRVVGPAGRRGRAAASSPSSSRACTRTTWPSCSTARTSACAPATTARMPLMRAPRRAGHRPRLVRPLQRRARTSTRWSTSLVKAREGLRRSVSPMDDLYRDYILDHYKRPRNFGELEPPDLDAHDHNPLCGDEMGVHIRVDDGKIAELRFHGQGCAISQAAASIASEEYVGMAVERGRRARRRVADRPARHPDLARRAASARCSTSRSCAAR